MNETIKTLVHELGEEISSITFDNVKQVWYIDYVDKEKESSRVESKDLMAFLRKD
jgi:hypothetical protein